MKMKVWLPVFVLLIIPQVVGAVGFWQADPSMCNKTDGTGCGPCDLIKLGNAILDWLKIVGPIIATILMVYAGTRMVISGGNQAEKEAAKKIITNTLIGLVILLAAWLLVDEVMEALGQSGWDDIACVENLKPAQPVKSINSVLIGGVVYNSGGITDYSDLPVAPFEAGDCSPESLQSHGFSIQDSRVMSCIAGPESGCNLNAQNPWSSARGVFQIVRGIDDKCHNLNIPECSAAAGVSGNLNCSDAFIGGTSESNPSRAKPGYEDLFAKCNAAASNMTCNAAAAKCLLGNNSKYSHWLGRPGVDEHQAQRACVAKYGG